MTLLRTDSFVPLTHSPAAGERPDFRVTVISQSAQAKPFQSLEQDVPSPAENASKSHGKACEPRIAVQRDGDRISSIRVQCSCGQTIDLACVYQDKPSGPSS